LIILIEIKIQDKLVVLCMFPIFTVGDHPDKLGDQVVETFGRVRTTDGMILSARFGGFRQGMLKPTRVGCHRFP
jgi:hypothetical protein